MSWIERVVEEQLAKAAADGELVAEPLKGKPIPGIDDQRPDGWWANSFVRRERSHDRRIEASERLAATRATFWRADSERELRALVDAANADVDATNVNLVATDQLGRFDVDDIVDRWRRLRAT
ncbi:MAG: hypothetical protein AAFP84_21210 [Actinomycetota bacterium]